MWDVIRGTGQWTGNTFLIKSTFFLFCVTFGPSIRHSFSLKFATFLIRHILFFFQGICPGNRLQEIRTYDSGCYSMSPASSPCPSSIGSSTMSLLNSSLSMTTSPSLSSQQELIYENTLHLAALQRQDSRRSWQLPSNQVSEWAVTETNCRHWACVACKECLIEWRFAIRKSIKFPHI